MPSTLAQDLLSLRNARLGTIGVYVGAEDLAYGSATGWTDLGVMDPGTFAPDFPREMFKLMLGLPRSNKLAVVTGASGMVDFTLTEYTPYAAEVAAGSGAGVRTYAATPAPTTIASGGTVNGGVLTSATGFAVGQMVEVTVGTATYLTYIYTLASTTVTWVPALPVAATTGAFKAVKTVTQALGTVQLPRFAFKAVFTDQNGEIVTIYMPACSIASGWSPVFGDATTNVKLPMKFEAYGKGATWNGATEQILAYIYHDLPGVS